ncbi:PQQ-binding-like beta-propeller repeat protein [Salinibaculum marinum]|uniref:outer membrane protein assembly factor BamB family protein n=2 Tax=Salinibaculum TaxID=2732368 RepID=UPI0030D23F23
MLAVLGTAATGAVAGCNALEDSSDPEPFHDGDWHSYGNSPQNASHVEGGVPAPDEHTQILPAQWQYAPPVVYEDIVYFAADRQVTAVTPDGAEQWSRRLETPVSGAPALDPTRGRLYVPTRIRRPSSEPAQGSAAMTILALSDGEVVDTYRVGDRRTYGATVVSGDVYARSATACVRLGPDGTERWRQPLEALSYEEYRLGDDTATQVAPAVTDDGVYVPDYDSLVKLDPASGEERWRVPVDTPYAASVVGDSIVQTGWQETVAVEPSGDVRWRRDLSSRAAAAVAADGDVYVVAGDLHELDAETGETNWQAHVPTENTAAPVVTDENVLVECEDLRAFRREANGLLGPERERWRVSSVQGATLSSPVIAAGRAFIVGATGLVALRSTENA